MPRIAPLPSVALVLFGGPLFIACRDGLAPADRTPQANSFEPPPVGLAIDASTPLVDAADRLALAVEEATMRGALQTHLRDLAHASSTGRSGIAEQKLASARRLVKLLGEKGLASPADLDAIELALEEAAHRLDAISAADNLRRVNSNDQPPTSSPDAR